MIGPILWESLHVKLETSLLLESHGEAPTGNFAAERRFVGEGLGFGIVVRVGSVQELWCVLRRS